MINNYRGVWQNLIAFVKLFLLLVGIILLEQITLVPLTMTIYLKGTLVKILLTSLTIGLQILFVYQVSKVYVRSVWQIKNITINRLLIIMFFGFVSMFILQLASSWLMDIGLVPVTGNQLILDNLDRHNNLGFYFMVILLAPISEELIFRGLLINKFIRTFGSSTISKSCAFIFSVVFFAFMHNPETLMSSLPYVLMGVVFTTVYLKSGNIVVSILVHMCANLIGIL